MPQRPSATAPPRGSCGRPSWLGFERSKGLIRAIGIARPSLRARPAARCRSSKSSHAPGGDGRPRSQRVETELRAVGAEPEKSFAPSPLPRLECHWTPGVGEEPRELFRSRSAGSGDRRAANRPVARHRPSEPRESERKRANGITRRGESQGRVPARSIGEETINPATNRASDRAVDRDRTS